MVDMAQFHLMELVRLLSFPGGMKKTTLLILASTVHRYQVALAELVRRKSSGKRIVAVEEEAPARGNVINLMDALRKSVKAAEKPAEKQDQAASTRPKKKTRSK